MRVLERIKAQSTQCEHPETRTTTNFGIERIACVVCRHVEVHNLAHQTVVRAEPRAASARR
ncbi:MAG TPA: hypothetical protein VHL52_03600 [Acidimicrobiia bacterium]|nr:hypothetical protein [Acidimicrobiia bacterium]